MKKRLRIKGKPGIKNIKIFEGPLGFTLIELLVVISILSILAVVGLASFQTVMIKARDSKRKSDLEQLQRALEMYHNDYKSYPQANASGQIVIGGEAFDWASGVELKDSNGTIYMKKLPNDPATGQTYCYLSSSGSSYIIYARLENLHDLKLLAPARNCGGSSDFYNYGVSSSDENP